jgi:hypothetical protein
MKMEEKIFNTKLLVVLSIVSTLFNFLIYREVFGNINKIPDLWLINTIFSAYLMIMFGVRLELLRTEQRRKNK